MNNSHSIYIGNIRGVSVYFDIFVLPAFIILYISGGIGFSLLFIPVFVIHELSHMLAAYLFEYRICNFTVMPFGGNILLDTSQKQNISQLIAIYLFAPFVNIMLFCVLYAVGIAYNSVIFIQIALVNGAFALFSFLPVYPLDGGNVIKALLSSVTNERRSLNILFLINLTVSLLLLTAFFCIIIKFGKILWQIPFAAIFLVYSSYLNKKKCTSNYIFDIINKDSKLKKSVTLQSKCIYVFHTASIAQALRSAGRDTVNIFRIVDDNFNVIGELNERELLDATLNVGINANVCLIEKVKKRHGAYMLL